MEEIKEEIDFKVLDVMKESLGKKMDKIKSHADDVLVFTLQWKDLEEYLNLVEAKVENRLMEVKSREVELRKERLALDERAKVVAAAEAEMSALETKADGFRTQIVEKTKELDFLRNRIDCCVGEFKLEEMKLIQLRTSVGECVVEHRSKTSQLDEVVKLLSNTQADLVRSLDRRSELEEEMKRKTKALTLVLDKIAECEKLLEARSSELRTTQDELELKGNQLQQMNFDLERRRCELSAEEEHLGGTQARSRVLEEEIERKGKELSAVLHGIADSGKRLKLVEEQLDSQKKLLETRSSELDSKEKELEGLREAGRCSSMDLDLREHRLKDVSEQVESKSKELNKIEKLIEEKNAHCISIKTLIEEHAEELVSNEKKQNEMTEAIRKLSMEISSKEKTLERAKVFIEQLSEKLQSKERRLERCTAEYDSKKKELRSVKGELNSLQSLIIERNKQVEEGEKKMHHIDNSNKELLRQIQLKKKEVCTINNAIRECSIELESKRGQYDQVQTSITDLTAQLNSKERDLFSVDKKIQESLEDFRSKEEQQVRIEVSLMEREQKLGLKEKQLDALSEKIELKEKDLDVQEKRIDEKGQEVAQCVEACERKANELFSFLQQGKQDQHVNLLQDANVRDDKTLQLLLQGHLKKCPQLYYDVSSALKTSSDPAKLALDTIQELYSAHLRMAISNRDPNGVRRSIICLLDCLMDISPKPQTEVHEEAMKFAIEWKNTTLVKADNPIEVLFFLHFLAAFSLAYTFDADKVHNLFDATFLGKYAPSLCETLGISALAPVTNERHPPEAPINNSSGSLSPDVQEMETVSPWDNEDILRDHDVSASFSPNEVSTELPLIENPGKFVLNSVKDALTGAHQRGELGLAEPMVKTLLPFLEEVTRVVSPIDPDLQLDAAKVAQRWSKMMGTSGQLSPLEALGFLQFIVAYGLVNRTNPNETLRFAVYVAHFKQAPKLFHSLGLSGAIPSFVKELLDNRQYIPAVRFMVCFNLTSNCSPLLVLKEEISNLRRSAKANRRVESQAEDRDAGKLREIIELIGDFNLEVDLPVDLIVKFMVPRKTPNESRCIVSSSVQIQPPQILPPPLHMQASHTVIHSSYISTRGVNQSYPASLGVSPNQQVLDVETYETVGSTAFQGQSSHQAGNKRPRVDFRYPRSAIRRCFDPSGSGRF